MRYVGMYTQQVRNNTRSLLLLMLFPCIILGMVWAFFVIISYLSSGEDAYGNVIGVNWEEVTYMMSMTTPWVVGIVGIWFLISYSFNTTMIRSATGARPLTRRENPRIYNIVENLCMTAGMDMPQINVIDDQQLNAFASGIDKKSYTVTICLCQNGSTCGSKIIQVI